MKATHRSWTSGLVWCCHRAEETLQSRAQASVGHRRFRQPSPPGGALGYPRKVGRGGWREWKRTDGSGGWLGLSRHLQLMPWTDESRRPSGTAQNRSECPHPRHPSTPHWFVHRVLVLTLPKTAAILLSPWFLTALSSHAASGEGEEGLSHHSVCSGHSKGPWLTRLLRCSSCVLPPLCPSRGAYPGGQQGPRSQALCHCSVGDQHRCETARRLPHASVSCTSVWSRS